MIKSYLSVCIISCALLGAFWVASGEARASTKSTFHEAKTSPERALDAALKTASQKDLVFSLIRGTSKDGASGLVFSEALVAAWKHANQKLLNQNCGGHEIEGELCGLDYDPFLCAQDDNNGRFAFNTLEENAGSAVISMRWIGGDADGRALATYRLTKTAHNRWIIDGVSCRNGDRFNMTSE